MRHPQRLVGAIVAGGLLLCAAPAPADVSGPDDSIDTAFGPLLPDTSYAGRFVSEGDVDYLAFDVARAGIRLHFDVTNTVAPCTSLEFTGCPVHGTLLDGTAQQLGGEESGAGTGPVTDASPSDVIDWTFDAPGRYYLAMDSGGDEPSYAVAYHEVPPDPPSTGASTGAPGAGGSSAGGGSPAPGRPKPPAAAADGGRAITALRATPAEDNRAVRVRVSLGTALRALTVRLEDPAARTVAVRRRGPLAAGTLTLTLRPDATAQRSLTRHGTARLRVRVTATPTSGRTQTARRAVRLRR
jgi:hypothetical protein